MTALADVSYFEPWWAQIIKSIAIFAVIFAILPVLIVYERKLLGRFQGRYGPNRVGPFGLMQPLAEIVKFAMKEPFRTTTSIGTLYRLAPMISIIRRPEYRARTTTPRSLIVPTPVTSR